MIWWWWCWWQDGELIVLLQDLLFVFYVWYVPHTPARVCTWNLVVHIRLIVKSVMCLHIQRVGIDRRFAHTREVCVQLFWRREKCMEQNVSHIDSYHFQSWMFFSEAYHINVHFVFHFSWFLTCKRRVWVPYGREEPSWYVNLKIRSRKKKTVCKLITLNLC